MSLFATNNFYISVDSIKDCINAILYAIKQVVNTESCKIVSNVLSEVVIYSNSKTTPIQVAQNKFIYIHRKRPSYVDTGRSTELNHLHSQKED